MGSGRIASTAKWSWLDLPFQGTSSWNGRIKGEAMSEKVNVLTELRRFFAGAKLEFPILLTYLFGSRANGKARTSRLNFQVTLVSPPGVRSS